LGIGITDPIEVEDFNTQVESLTGITKEAIKETLGDAKRKKADEELGRNMNSLVNEVHQLVEAGNPNEALKHLMKETEDLKNTQTEEIPNTVYTKERLVEELKSTPDGIKTGFRSLDKYITLPSEGVSIIAGVSRHGKTTAMLNISNNALNNPEYEAKTFVYASFEETEKRLVTKQIMMNAREVLSEENNFSEYIKYLREGYSTNHWINTATKKVLSWTQQNRLVLLDMTGKNIETLENYVHYYCQRYEVGAVFVDYIQKIQAKESYTRQMELQKISHRILDLAKSSHIPIVLGAQFNKEGANGIDSMDLNHIREANDIGNDAHLVLGIWNTQAASPSDQTITRNPSQPVEFRVKVLKNRNGASNMIVDLNLFPENFKILDKGAAYGQH
jgi:replicative DNA helicase